MTITAERKQSIITDYATHEGDTGSPEVQVAILTDRILGLTEHLKAAPEGLRLAARPVDDGRPAPPAARLSARTQEPRYQKLIERLGLRR